MIVENVKQIKTTLIGLVVAAIVTFRLYNFESASFVWEGVVGYGVASVFFLLPDTVVTGLKRFIKSNSNKKI